MKILTVLSVGFAFLSGLIKVAGSDDHSLDCVAKCWENSRIVSSCSNETKCLCEDVSFQGAVFQCLYSQCPASQFGVALHQALMQCSTLESSDESIPPPLIRQQSLRKRSNNYSDNISGVTYVSGYATGSSTLSATHYRATGSVSGYYGTRSVRSSYYRSSKTYSPSTSPTSSTIPTSSASTTSSTLPTSSTARGSSTTPTASLTTITTTQSFIPPISTVAGWYSSII